MTTFQFWVLLAALGMIWATLLRIANMVEDYLDEEDTDCKSPEGEDW